MSIEDVIALFLISTSLGGLITLSWFLRLRTDGQLLRLRQFVDIVIFAIITAWIGEVLYYGELVDIITILRVRRLSFWLPFCFAIFWLLRGLLQKPSPATIMAPVPVAQVDMDIDGTVTRWNDAAVSLLGYTSAEAVGLTAAELIVPKPLHDLHLGGLQRYRRTGETHILDKDVPTVAKCKDGKIINVILHVRRHYSIDGLRFSADIRPNPLPLLT